MVLKCGQEFGTTKRGSDKEMGEASIFQNSQIWGSTPLLQSDADRYLNWLTKVTVDSSPKYLLAVRLRDPDTSCLEVLPDVHRLWNVLWFCPALLMFLLASSILCLNQPIFLSSWRRHVLTVCVISPLRKEIETHSSYKCFYCEAKNPNIESLMPGPHFIADPLFVHLLSLNTHNSFLMEILVCFLSGHFGECGPSCCFLGYYTVTFYCFAERTY